ncbi:MAG: hypothetical protein IKZ38_01555 [Clostridia bacterium]|nr:hypothetical protein [Clostridia bacterium]
MMVKRQINSDFLLFFFAVCLTAILTFNGGYQYAVTEGLKLWVVTVIPSMFPYFFLSTLLANLKTTGKLSLKLSPLTNRLFKTNGTAGYALMMSVISGYPMGAKLVCDLKKGGALSSTEAVRASVFCSTSSPLFMTATVGSLLFKSVKFGLLLSLTHLLSALITGVIFSFYKRGDKPQSSSKLNFETSNSIFYDSVLSTVNSTLFVGGIITLFYVFIEILLSVGLLTLPCQLATSLLKERALGEGLTVGLIESTRGFLALSKAPIRPITLAVASAISGFGGLSVIAQSVVFLSSAKIKTACFYLGKITHAVISFIIGLILGFIFF